MKFYFDFWNQFVQQWLQQNPTAFTLFSLPKFSWSHQLLNSDAANDYSTLYLPEPYWGWTNDDPLEMVVVNYNPYSGGPVQHIEQVSQALSRISYREFIQNQKASYHAQKLPELTPTSDWHFNRRNKKIAAALELLGYVEPITNHNYLGIDLIPWHTKDIRPLNSYFEQNKQAIASYSINFAIEASKLIANPFLKNKVIFRMSWSRFNKAFGIPQDFSFKRHEKIATGKIIDNCYRLSNPETATELLFIWSNKRRNDLPPADIISQFL